MSDNDNITIMSDSDDEFNFSGRLDAEDSDSDVIYHDSEEANISEDEENLFEEDISFRNCNLDNFLDMSAYEDLELINPNNEDIVIIDKNEEIIIWGSEPPPSQGGRRACDKIIAKPGLTQTAKEIRTIIDAFSLMITSDIIEILVQKTSINLALQHAKMKDVASDKYTWLKPTTDEEEMRAFLGIIIIRGMLGKGMHSTNSLYSETGNPIYPSVMSRNRFKLLLTCLAFESRQTTIENWPEDRAASVRNVLEKWNNNLGRLLVPSEFLTIDESHQKIRHKISIRTFNPRKPGKYGLNVKSLNDARVPYTYRTSLYAGNPEKGNGPYYISDIKSYVHSLVDGLSKFINRAGKTITLGRSYGDVSLAQELLMKKMTTIMIMNSNRKGIPAQLKETKNRAVNSNTLHFMEPERNLILHAHEQKQKQGKY